MSEKIAKDQILCELYSKNHIMINHTL